MKSEFWEQIDEWLWERALYRFLWDQTWGRWYSFWNPRQLKRDIIKRFGKIPEVGDQVCDCTYRHVTIVKKNDIDNITVERSDGVQMGCSLWHCCDPIDHEWKHPYEPIDHKWEHPTKDVDLTRPDSGDRLEAVEGGQDNA